MLLGAPALSAASHGPHRSLRGVARTPRAARPPVLRAQRSPRRFSSACCRRRAQTARRPQSNPSLQLHNCATVPARARQAGLIHESGRLGAARAAPARLCGTIPSHTFASARSQEASHRVGAYGRGTGEKPPALRPHATGMLPRASDASHRALPAAGRAESAQNVRTALVREQGRAALPHRLRPRQLLRDGAVRRRAQRAPRRLRGHGGAPGPGAVVAVGRGQTQLRRVVVLPRCGRAAARHHAAPAPRAPAARRARAARAPAARMHGQWYGFCACDTDIAYRM